VAKAYEAALSGAADIVVCLVPARTDTKWWHDYASKGEIRFLKGHVKFGDAKANAPFPSAVVVFRRNTDPRHSTVAGRKTNTSLGCKTCFEPFSAC
jgi:hypothetical protein